MCKGSVHANVLGCEELPVVVNSAMEGAAIFASCNEKSVRIKCSDVQHFRGDECANLDLLVKNARVEHATVSKEATGVRRASVEFFIRSSDFHLPVLGDS